MARIEEASVWCPPGWERDTYRHDDHQHLFYVVGGDYDGGRPAVLLMHEFPGITPALVDLATTLAAHFRVVVPSILGRDGNPGTIDSLRQICVRREIHAFARDGNSRSAHWLRAFASEHVSGGRPYGVIGMCFTGGYALALAVDDQVKAVVVAQQATPILPRRSLGLSQEDSNTLAARKDLCVRDYRFRRDPISPASKMEATTGLLGETVIVSTLTEPCQWSHSTLTGPRRDRDAVTEVVEFLIARLG